MCNAREHIDTAAKNKSLKDKARPPGRPCKVPSALKFLNEFACILEEDCDNELYIDDNSSDQVEKTQSAIVNDSQTNLNEVEAIENLLLNPPQTNLALNQTSQVYAELNTISTQF